MKKISTIASIFLFLCTLFSYGQNIKSLSEKTMVENVVYQYHKYWINGEYEKMIDLLCKSTIKSIVDGIIATDKKYPEEKIINKIEEYYGKSINNISSNDIALYVYKYIVQKTPMKDIVDIRINNSSIIGNRAVVRYSFLFVDGRIIDPGSMKLIKEENNWKILN